MSSFRFSFRDYIDGERLKSKIFFISNGDDRFVSIRFLSTWSLVLEFWENIVLPLLWGDFS